MTDRQALKALLDRFGLIPYADEPDASDEVVVLEAKRGNVSGYSGFVARFEFDSDGKFQSLGIWE